MKKILGTSLGIPIILALIALGLNQFSCSRRFSIETTSNQITLELETKAEQKPITMTTRPFLRNLTVLNDNIKLATSKFIISKTNQPELKGIGGVNVLEAKSNSQTYYEIKNTTNITIPIIIYCQLEKMVSKLTLDFKTENSIWQNSLNIQIPFTKTNIDLSTMQTTIQLRDSEIKYGTVTTNTMPNGTEITGEPHKIKIAMESSERAAVNLYTQKRKTYKLEIDNITPDIITKIQFAKASPETIIYRHLREPLHIKDKYPTNPSITITGKIRDISRLDITDQGITTTMQGDYVRIEIAGQDMKNTALDKAIDFLIKIWRFIKGE